MKVLSGKEFVSHVAEYVDYVDTTAMMVKECMVASAILGDEKHRKMAESMFHMLLKYGKGKRISTKLDMKDFDKTAVEELIEFYNRQVGVIGLNRYKAQTLLRGLKAAAFANRKYFETRDKIKYVGKELEVPIYELLDRHIKALENVLGYPINKAGFVKV